MTTLNEPAKTLRADRSIRPANAKPPRVLEFDPALFVHHLERWDASDEEKAEYLELIWQVVVQFVDLGFGIHPLSTAAQQSCGQLPLDVSSHDSQASDVVDWKEQFNGQTAKDVGVHRAAESEES